MQLAAASLDIPAETLYAAMARIPGSDTMKQIIAEVVKRTNDWMSTMLYCVGENGEVDKAVTDTLLDLIEQSFPHEDQLESLVALAEAGRYVSPNPALPDWGVNDTNIWLAAPMAKAAFSSASDR